MRPPAAGLLALGLAACNAQSGGTGARTQPAEVSMQPGMWETTYRILSIDLPTAPPEIVEGLRAGISTAPVIERSCLTPAEAAAPGNAVRDRTMRRQPGYVCETGESLFAGGRIRMSLSCRSTTGQPDLRQAMVGSYGAETLQAAVSGASVLRAGDTGPAYPVRVESTLTGRRIGDCPADAAN